MDNDESQETCDREACRPHFNSLPPGIGIAGGGGGVRFADPVSRSLRNCLVYSGLEFRVHSAASSKAGSQRRHACHMRIVRRRFPEQCAGGSEYRLRAERGSLGRDQPGIEFPSVRLQCHAPPACSTTQGVEICNGVPLTCGLAACQVPPQNCGSQPALGMRVSFGYKFNSPVPIGSWQSITLRASAQAQQEN